MALIVSKNSWRLGPVFIAGVTMVGIASGLQLTDAAGCELAEVPWILQLWPPVFVAPSAGAAPLNTILSGLLVCMLLAAAIVPQKVAQKVLGAEFVGFVLYLFLLKGGYAIGFSGAPDVRVIWYDTLALEGRLLVFAMLLLLRFRPHRPFLV